MTVQQGFLPFADPNRMPEIPAGCPAPPSWPPTPDWWDAVIVAFSGGVDSQAMLLRAAETYPRDRILAVFNDTGDDHSPDNQLVSFIGTREFVQQECDALGVPLAITHGPADILGHTGNRGMWADGRNRYCTSDLKRSPTDKLLRNLILELADSRGRWSSPSIRLCTNRAKERPTDKILRHMGAQKILLLTGELAEESPTRARKPEWQIRMGATAPTKGRLVMWHRPQLHWTKEQEILYIWSRGRDIAPTYYGGWDRLSCRFCFFLTWDRQVLSFVAYPEAAAEFVTLEEQMGHKVSLSYKWGQHQGYRAVWEFTYGPWGQPHSGPTDRALAVVDGLRREAQDILQALREGRPARFKRTGGRA